MSNLLKNRKESEEDRDEERKTIYGGKKAEGSEGQYRRVKSRGDEMGEDRGPEKAIEQNVWEMGKRKDR